MRHSIRTCPAGRCSRKGPAAGTKAETAGGLLLSGLRLDVIIPLTYGTSNRFATGLYYAQRSCFSSMHLLACGRSKQIQLHHRTHSMHRILCCSLQVQAFNMGARNTAVLVYAACCRFKFTAAVYLLYLAWIARSEKHFQSIACNRSSTSHLSVK